MRLRSLLALSSMIACAATPAPEGKPVPDAGASVVDDRWDAPGEDASVAAFARTPIHFGGGEDRREVTADVEFPARGTHAKVTLTLALDCPQGGCDAWDRFGSLALVPGDDPSVRVELARFITPYGVRGSWTQDVTALRPLLAGKQRLAAFIDTWVGPPGGANGAGWLFSATFDFEGGTPARVPVVVEPVFTRRDVAYGDPSRPIPAQLAPREVGVSPLASAWELRGLITGHGQGNADQCAEFCPKTHAFSVAGEAHSMRIWRDDCDRNPVSNQAGTWRFPRAGWCPGADVRPWVENVTASVGASPTMGSVTIGYDVEAYENSCRPGVAVCRGCTLGTGCDYDGGAHTEPRWSLSALLVGYR
jgi:hypothetical protein